MIWHDGRIMAPAELRVDLDDRIFEHGLGLFETFRSFQGRAPLLDRHLTRLRTSCQELGLSLEGVLLPDQAAVHALLEACGLGGDALLRITMTGGSARGISPRLWMTARPLPPVEPHPRKLVVHSLPVSASDPLGPYKTLNYWSRRMAFEWATSVGAIDCLLWDGDGRLWEASRNNVLFVPAARPRTVITPALAGPIVPGIMRRAALDFAAENGYEIEERPVLVGELERAEAIFLTNSVRGVRRIEQFENRLFDLEEQAEITRLLVEELPRAIEAGRYL